MLRCKRFFEPDCDAISEKSPTVGQFSELAHTPSSDAISEKSPTVRRAFTLIELVVVMIVLALLSSLVVFSLRGTMDHHQLSRAVETFEIFDARARRDARSAQAQVLATIDRNRGRLTVGDRRDGATYHLPRQVEIAEIRLRRGSAVGSSMSIDVGRQGQTPTYAVCFQRGKTSRWLVVLGLSGQVIALDDQEEVDEILSL